MKNFVIILRSSAVLFYFKLYNLSFPLHAIHFLAV